MYQKYRAVRVANTAKAVGGSEGVHRRAARVRLLGLRAVHTLPIAAARQLAEAPPPLNNMG